MVELLESGEGHYYEAREAQRHKSNCKRQVLVSQIATPILRCERRLKNYIFEL